MVRPHVLACAGAALCLAAVAFPTAGFAATYYVDRQNPVATDAGPGSAIQPYRTIAAAVTQRGGPGVTILVMPGTYTETVTVGASGTAGSPFVIEAQGTVTLDANGQSYGFRLSGRSYVTIRGFRVTRATSKGIYASSASNNFTFQNNVVTLSGSHGIYYSGSSNGLIENNEVANNADHGIYLSSGVTGTTLRRNYSHHNARPDVRAANGIQLNGSSGNRIEGNRLGNNQDTGLQINTGSNNNVCVQNVSWNNGDHGYDHLGSSGNVHMGDVAYGNYKDGFSFEGNAPGGKVYNCIGVNNGTTTGEFDLWVDDQSSSGFVSNDNLFWNSTSQSPIKYRSSTYSTVAAFSNATGHDTRSLQANPKFVDAAAGDFRLLAGSPAIDSGNSGAPSWVATDATGASRFDDPSTPNSGTGAIPYADRGAHEFGGGTPPSSQAPVARLTVSPTSGEAPLAVTADASASTDPDGKIVSYRFDFGDGTVVGPQAGAVATHTYTPGSWNLQVTVTDNDGWTSTASRIVSVSGPDQPPVVNAPSAVAANEGQALTVQVTASDPDANPILSLTADFSGLPAGHNAQFTAGSGNTTGTFTWTPTFTNAGTYTVTFRAANALSATKTTTITVANVDRAPVVSAPTSLRGTQGSTFTVNVTASDPDGDPITSMTVNTSGLPNGQNATFTVNGSNTAGTFTWTAAVGQTGNFTVTFRAANALSGTASTRLQVRKNGSGEATEGDLGAPLTLALSPALPNPSRERVAFELDLPSESVVEWSVYDLQGRKLWGESGPRAAGRHVLSWDGMSFEGRRTGSGLYFVRVRAGDRDFTRRIVRM